MSNWILFPAMSAMLNEEDSIDPVWTANIEKLQA